ncbi:hypothetical protein GCM10009742_31160 [Kribbella karoonensis]|uniref:Uncharacterized protein n=1 Tax=Kribbella karoonensis TaxID=324851 RepID=A0ABP4PMZ6_9ACTN
MRRGPVTLEMLSDWGLREATKGRPSTGSQKITSVLGAHAKPPQSSDNSNEGEGKGSAKQ